MAFCVNTPEASQPGLGGNILRKQSGRLLRVSVARERLRGTWPWTFRTHPSAPGLLSESPGRPRGSRAGQPSVGCLWPLHSPPTHPPPSWAPGLQCSPPSSGCLSHTHSPVRRGDTGPLLHHVRGGLPTAVRSKPSTCWALGVPAHALSPSGQGCSHQLANLRPVPAGW